MLRTTDLTADRLRPVSEAVDCVQRVSNGGPSEERLPRFGSARGQAAETHDRCLQETAHPRSMLGAWCVIARKISTIP